MSVDTSGAKEILDVPLDDEVSKAFLEYSMSVVYSRAVPDINGFKPVQTRLLYSMFEEGYTPEKGFVKSAKPVSATMGNYHPHGDSSIYMALVKLAQPFYLNVPLVEGYGNWGDATGSPPAASRYTECKLSKEAMYLLEELKENVVDYRDNYDGERREPVTLPCQFPNLVVNGNFGIAVGFASNFAPHNMTEALDGALLLLKNPEATIDQLMKVIPGPDFPTGATIIGQDGIRKAYETGQGIIKIQSKYEIKPTARGKNEIAFTELPYGVKTETILNKIKDGMAVGRFSGLADAKDLTDRKNGLRFVVETKAGANPQTLVAELFKYTPLEDSFGINNYALVDGEPTLVGLKDMLAHFIAHRIDVVTRRSQSRRDKRAARLHIVEGLLKSLANIDKVIKIVRASDNAAAAQSELIRTMKIDEIQADYILSLPLRRLTRLEQLELDSEKKKLEEEIAELDAILGNDETLRKTIATELTKVKKDLGRPRRSVLSGVDMSEHLEVSKAAMNAASQIEDVANTLAVYASGSLTRTADAPVVSARGKIDPIVSTLLTSARASFLAITNTGRAQRIDVIHVGENSKVTPANAGITLKKGERLIALAPADPGKDSTGVLVLGTRKGVVKTVKPDWVTLRADEFEVIGLADGDELLSGRWMENSEDIEYTFMTRDAILRFAGGTKTVRAQGRTGGGVAGISLPAGTEAMAFSALTAEEASKAEFFVVVTDSANKPIAMKRSLLADVPVKGRATGGQRHVRLLKGQNGVLSGAVLRNALILNQAGKLVQRGDIAKRDGSATLFSEPVESVSFGESQ